MRTATQRTTHGINSVWTPSAHSVCSIAPRKQAPCVACVWLETAHS